MGNLLFLVFLCSKCCCCCLSRSVVSDSAAPWTVACQAPLSMGCSRKEYWNGLPFPLPGDLPNGGIKPKPAVFLALAGRLFATEPPGSKPTPSATLSSNRRNVPSHACSERASCRSRGCCSKKRHILRGWHPLGDHSQKTCQQGPQCLQKTSEGLKPTALKLFSHIFEP